MLGNSPKSDINPALAVGLNAVFVPQLHTWVLERQEIRPGRGRLIVVEQFRDLQSTSELTGSQFATHGRVKSTMADRTAAVSTRG